MSPLNHLGCRIYSIFATADAHDDAGVSQRNHWPLRRPTPVSTSSTPSLKCPPPATSLPARSTAPTSPSLTGTVRRPFHLLHPAPLLTLRPRPRHSVCAGVPQRRRCSLRPSTPRHGVCAGVRCAPLPTSSMLATPTSAPLTLTMPVDVAPVFGAPLPYLVRWGCIARVASCTLHPPDPSSTLTSRRLRQCTPLPASSMPATPNSALSILTTPVVPFTLCLTRRRRQRPPASVPYGILFLVTYFDCDCSSIILII